MYPGQYVRSGLFFFNSTNFNLDGPLNHLLSVHLMFVHKRSDKVKDQSKSMSHILRGCKKVLANN